VGKKSKPKAPKAPDVNEMIDKQAEANRVNIYNPYGSQEYSKNPDGTWVNNVQFTPEMQALFDRQLSMAGAAPTTYKSGGMGDNLRARIDAKLGRGAPSEYNAPEYGAVQMPESPPEEIQQPQPQQVKPQGNRQPPQFQGYGRGMR